MCETIEVILPDFLGIHLGEQRLHLRCIKASKAKVEVCCLDVCSAALILRISPGIRFHPFPYFFPYFRMLP